MANFDFFLSYASADREWADWLAWELESQGFNVWLDSHQLQPGDLWAARLSDAIADSKFVIVLVSKNYLEARFTASEWLSAFLRGPVEGPQVIPIRIQDVSAPLLLHGLATIDLFGITKQEASARIKSFLHPSRVDALSVTPPSYPGDVAGVSKPERAAPGRVFVSYSHADANWLKRILVFLRPVEREGSIDVWSDKRILTGERWRTEIEEALTRADVAILLVSSDFLASEFVHNEELPRILKRAEEGSTKIYSLILRPSSYVKSPLGQFQSFNPPSEPLSKLKVYEREELLVRFADLIEDSFE